MIKEWWNDFVGVPFKEHGFDRTGCDCGGLVLLVYKEVFAIDLPAWTGYESSRQVRDTSRVIELAKESGLFKQVTADERKDGDLVVMLMGRFACHVGIVANGGTHVLHVIEGANSIQEKLLSIRWGSRIDSFWRYNASELPRSCQSPSFTGAA